MKTSPGVDVRRQRLCDQCGKRIHALAEINRLGGHHNPQSRAGAEHQGSSAASNMRQHQPQHGRVDRGRKKRTHIPAPSISSVPAADRGGDPAVEADGTSRPGLARPAESGTGAFLHAKRHENLAEFGRLPASPPVARSATTRG